MEDVAVDVEVQSVSNDEISNVSQAKGNQKQFLSFAAGDEEFAIELIKIREIKNCGDITRIPNAPKFMRGVMNLRGAVIPIFDLKMRLEMGVVKSDESSVVIIASILEKQMGILVDSVSDILSIDANDIAPAPRVDTGVGVHCLEGVISVESRMVVILHLENLFSEEVLQDAKIGDVHDDAISSDHLEEHISQEGQLPEDIQDEG